MTDIQADTEGVTQEFDFQYEEDGSLSRESAVFQALGAASMCWSKVPSGIFESDRAKEIGDKLCSFLFDDEKEKTDGA